MEALIIIEKKEIPMNWKTAEECHAIALDWKNAEIKTCIDTIMEKIVKAAQRGGICASIAVAGRRPEHFYKVLENTMTSLGYSVNVPRAPHIGDSSVWEFAW